MTINKKRILLFLLFLIATAMLLSACGNDNENSGKNQDGSEQESQQNNLDNSNSNESETEDSDEAKDEINSDELDNMVKHFEDNGFDIGVEATKAAEMVGATGGFGIELDGTIIELYLYEDDSSDLEKIKENGEYSIQGLAFPVIANGNIVLMNHDEHPEEDDVVDVFKSY